jgi:xanthine dehydrogenase YagR molybdenum-binding subunit
VLWPKHLAVVLHVNGNEHSMEIDVRVTLLDALREHTLLMDIGQALLEEGSIDPRDGRVTNANLAEYVVAVNADVPDIQTVDVGVPDYQATALGGKAVGELGIVGVAAAIGNAIFHATGKRVRDLPILLEKLV